jgi:hypothetical protein
MNANHCCNTWWKTPWGICGLVTFSVALTYLAVFQWSFFIKGMPFLFLLACPLMHLFMHHGNEGGSGKGTNKTS